MELLITGIGQLVTPRPQGVELTVLEDCYIKISGERIAELGPLARAPACREVLDAKGGVVIPGLVDPHTHAVFAGTREEEFLRRCQGEPYSGGGILATVAAVRQAGEEELYQIGKRFLLEMLRSGTTTVEVKSGYGLDFENELKLLRVINKLNEDLPLDIVPTFLGAHAVPEGKSSKEYVEEVLEMIPKIKGTKPLAEFCDVFCEPGFFSLEESRKILLACKGAGLKLKLHADELRYSGGAELAAELGAVSADHLLRVSDEGIERLAQAGVVPVPLPGTAFILNADYAPARKMLEAGLPVALGTDFNPGTCPIHSMLFILSLAVLRMGLTVEEALLAATRNAAWALDRHDRGLLAPGMLADLVILALGNYRQIPYFIGHDLVRYVLKRGEVVYANPRLC
ncbi:MAG: imidazolonepropionase [Candidatus Bipolaricaulia bacterium]